MLSSTNPQFAISIVGIGFASRPSTFASSPMFSATGLVPDLLQLIIIGEAKMICSMGFSAKRSRLMGDLNLECEENSLYGESSLAKEPA